VRTVQDSGGASGRPAAPSYEFGPFRLDVAEQRLLRDGHPVPLTPKVFAVLRVLVQHGGHLVEKDALLQEVWPDSFVEEGALSRSVSVLRKALGEKAAGAEYIETVPKRGYRFVAPVTVPVADQPLPGVPPMRRAATAWRAVGPAAAVLTFVVLVFAVLGVDSSNRRGPPAIAPAHRQVTSTGTARAPAISPDGMRMAYVSEASPDKTLMVQDVEHGQAFAVFSAPEVGHLRWSPDGSTLLVWARGPDHNGLYVMSPMGGAPRLIAADRYLGSWSPDGSTIAVPHYLGGTIEFFDTRGQMQRTIELLGAQWSIGDIDWSRANLLTLVSNDQRRRYTIWTVRLDGTEQRQVLTGQAEISAARWGSEAGAIYFSRRIDQTMSVEKIAVLPDAANDDASVTAVLTGLETDGSLSMSAAGTRLLYTRSSFHSNLWRLDVDGRPSYTRADATPLTHATALVERPDISPDGTTVVFNIGREPKTELYTMPLGGGTPHQLTHLNAFTLGGVWSADGRSIAFTSTRTGPPRAWTIDGGGRVLRALAEADVSDTFEMAWAPSSRILFHQAGNRNYHDVDPGTRDERVLVDNSEVGWMFSPVASPDGRQVAVHWNRPPDRGVWIIDTRARTQRLIYRTAKVLTTMPIRWASDGRAIYAVAGTPSAARGLTARLGETLRDATILRVPIDGGAVQTVAVIPFEEIGGVSITPDGRTLVFAVYSSTPSDVWVVDHLDGKGGRD
jgi:DNA-binding winged helix-turn-helix (wHTH) protein/Tol biopolymer transport system component